MSVTKFKKRLKKSWVWRHILVIPALRRLKQEDYLEFLINPKSRARPCFTNVEKKEEGEGGGGGRSSCCYGGD